MSSAEERLNQFCSENNAATKGPLSLLVQLTRSVKGKQFPLESSDLLTENKGQVAGLGGANLQKILKEYGIKQVLAAEGGRTSRGNMGLMMKYVEFLNAWQREEPIDFASVEAYWAERVRDYFNNQPFKLTADPSKTIGASLDELFDQARKRQQQNTGTQYMGTILQHLVASKLSVILHESAFEIHGASVADTSSERTGDFVIKDTVIHCTTAPGEPLIKKCRGNLEAGCRPIVITVFERTRTAMDLIADADLKGRIDVWDIQQFLSSNVFEHSAFSGSARNGKLADIINRYNAIVSEKETDPSLRIEFEAR